MSIALMKKLIEEYDPRTISSDEINGLTAMLQLEAFEPLHSLIVSKIKEAAALKEKPKRRRRKAKEPGSDAMESSSVDSTDA
jgi:hypothetical protein